jgi:hypothetical protein
MSYWSDDGAHCGTVHCIGGWAEKLGKVEFVGARRPKALECLFYPDTLDDDAIFDIDWTTISSDHAASALRNYLTLGDPQWDQVIAAA